LKKQLNWLKNKAFPIQREVDSAEKNAEEEACVLPTTGDKAYLYKRRA
jgi:hypothetical protein